MSFSFRNIFSPDESGFEENPEGAIPGGFSVAGEAPSGRGNLDGRETPDLAQGAYQTFLAGELLAFIPPAISARSGIPMEREIHVPVPASGSLEVKLSTLYELCPELFAAEITPLNDSTVPLPPRLGATPATAATASAAGAKGFSAHGAKPGSDNPFWSPPGAAQPSSPAAPTPAPTTPAGNPFAAAESAESPAPSKPAGGFDGPIPPQTQTPTFGGSFSEFSAFASFEPKEGGNAFGDPPPASPSSHGPGGREDAPSPNPFESDKGFVSLFSKQAEADAAIPFPEKPIESGGDDPIGVWGAMFGGTVSEPGGGAVGTEAGTVAAAEPESIGNLLKQGGIPTGFDAPSPPAATAASASPAPAPEADAPPFASGFGAYAPPASPPAMNEATSAPAAPEATLPAGFSGFASPPATEPVPLPVEKPAPMPESAGFEAPAPSAPAPAPEPAVDPFTAWNSPTHSSPPEAPPASEAFAARTPPAEPSSAEPAVAAEVEPVEETNETPVVHKSDRAVPVARIEALATTASVSVPARAVEPTAPSDERDLELRAIFSTSESFTLSKVARRVVGLPGVRSCSLSTPAKIVHASRSEENRLGNEAREMVSTLRNLAKLTGLPEARTFTLQTDRGIVSLFLEGDHCVTVHHDSADFGPGVREKLILVARNLAKLNE